MRLWFLSVQYLVQRSFLWLLVVISFSHCSKFSEHSAMSPPQPVWTFGFYRGPVKVHLQHPGAYQPAFLLDK